MKAADRSSAPWTDDEIETLRRYAPLGAHACAKRLRRSYDAVRMRAYTLGIQLGETTAARHGMPWTAKDVRMLELNYAEYGPAICAEHLGRTTTAVWAKAKSLGLQAPGRRRYWTPADDAWLLENYTLAGAAYCAEYLGRTQHAVELRARSIGAKHIPHHRPWTTREQQRVREVITALGAELQRSPAAISSCMARMMYVARTWPDTAEVPEVKA